MLRVFVDTYDKNFSEDIDSFNVQHVSFEKLIFSKEKLNSFKKVVEQYVKNKDRVIILTLDARISKAYYSFLSIFNDENIAVINTFLPTSALDLIVKEVYKYKDESLSFIEEKVEKLSNLLNSFYLMWGSMV
jgi:fatty acid-binding protein DegV